MDVFRAIYTSQPFGFDDSILRGILSIARQYNARDGITGALICRADIYLQWLEGPEDKVRATVARIAADDRHLEMKLHVSEPAQARMFGEWDMLHDPAATWIWTPEAIAGGALDRATPEEVVAFFVRLRGGAGVSAV
ncbi:MAG: blue light sensor protein [Novosphingobium sp. 28-62-57]|uniref:BLUF domain-containing protein n=1 Tax=Novosphingobium sp. 28-62-57 TaxID=1970409 RepID=UPI000BDBEFFB|nr:BLUF domain-containing protein [Novosphingobium sp. 28-62-57]OYW50898.1 MAG: blue light sensor protein [Novosphingobium sp. 12-62-10]OYZ09964.1 MAG: blue light sensor protein [Novosphingobium sp. 28-62-57]HQS69647.1 BLUF domain-containing protein [Novosphingobium sp.]